MNAGLIILVSLITMLLLMMLWIIFTPVLLLLDTDTHRYEVWQRGTFFMALKPRQKFTIEMQLFGINIPIRKKQRAEDTVKPLKKKKKRKPLKKSFRAWVFLIKGCLKSLRLKRLIMDIDTSDVVVNAQLIPLLLWVSGGPVSLHTNFAGRVYLQAKIEARLYKVLWTFIKFLTKN